MGVAILSFRSQPSRCYATLIVPLIRVKLKATQRMLTQHPPDNSASMEVIRWIRSARAARRNERDSIRPYRLGVSLVPDGLDLV